MPPTTSLTSGDTEEIDSADFEQLAKQEILKCRLNTLKKQQAEYTEELAKLDRRKRGTNSRSASFTRRRE